MGMDPPWGQALLGVGSCMGMDPAWGRVLHGDGSCFGSGPAWGRALLGYTHPQTPQLAPAAPKARAMLTCPGHAAMHVHPQRAQPRRRTPQPPRCSTPTTPPPPPPPPPAPLPVLTGRPFTQLAQPVLQPGTARAAQPQCQHRQQHGAQQQSRGEGTAPYESRPSAPHGLHKAPLFVPPPRAKLCPHLLLVLLRGRCPGCPPARGCRRLGGPSPAHSGSARGCCTPGGGGHSDAEPRPLVNPHSPPCSPTAPPAASQPTLQPLIPPCSPCCSPTAHPIDPQPPLQPHSPPCSPSSHPAAPAAAPQPTL